MTNRVGTGLLWLLVCAGGAIGCCATARAQGLQISPILIELPPGQMTTTLMVTNKGAVQAALQLRPFLWDQASLDDSLKPTPDLVASPPITTVDPGETQTFRLVLRRPATGREASYRLLLDQLPPPASPGTVRVALRFSIPVFAEPDARVEKHLGWQILIDRSGAALVGVNHGGRHVRILNPVLTQENGSRLALNAVQTPYILPGAERRWTIRGGSALRPGSVLRLAATSDGGPVEATVRVPGL